VTRLFRPIVVLLMLALLGACGFEMRHSSGIPFHTFFIGLPDTHPIAVELRRNIRTSETTRIVTDLSQAEGRLLILSEQRQGDILTIDSTGAAAEYNLIYRLRFSVDDAHGHPYIQPTELVLTRIIEANANAVQAEEANINALYRDMQSDAVQQILRRIAAIKPGVLAGPAHANPP
jgi:LPS-assembly lipoprotein